MSGGLASNLVVSAMEGGVAQAPGHSLLTLLLRLAIRLEKYSKLHLSMPVIASLFNGFNAALAIALMYANCAKVTVSLLEN